MKNPLLTFFRLPLIAALLLASVPGTGDAQDQKPAEPQLKDLNGFFPFKVPETLEKWEIRKEELTRRVLVANNLWPMPERTPLNAVVHGKVERDGFTIEKVYFESVPGFRVTGLLFRPADAPEGKKLPAVLSPHGHGGRLMDLGEEGVLKQIEIGGEKFADSGRFPKVARCVTLARMGVVTFLYDMIGYADNQQLSRQLGHGFSKQRPDFEGKESWGFYSAQAEMRLQSIFGLQTWNSIRALDFLEGLPDVDPARIGVTGGSGGGTQSIILCAVDSRPIAAFPNGMVSSSMQGGCTCENASLLRIGTGNVELAALYAPKPQGMTSADDWTKKMLVPGKGFPELKKLYTMYGKPENVLCEDLTHFKHNYNYVTREIMYRWFNKHMNLGLEEPIVEKDFPRLTAKEHAVYNDTHPRPEGGDAFEKKLTRWLADTSDKQLAAMQTDKRNQIVRDAWKTIVRADDLSGLQIDEGFKKKLDSASGKMLTLLVDGSGKGEVEAKENRYHLVVLHPETEETPVVTNNREFAGYTHGYNDSLFAKRVQQVVACIEFAHAKGAKINLQCRNGSEPVALAAVAVSSKGAVDSVFLENDGFQFKNITSYRDPNFVPGAVKYGDTAALLELVQANGAMVAIP